MARILIVDDEWTMRFALHEMLSAAGYSVAGEAETGRQAVEMAGELQPDLILMDIVMPGDMDGISAAEEIKADSKIPIVFISGYGDPEYIDRAKRLEPFGYVMKPFDETEVKAFVEIAIYKNNIEKKLEQANRERQRLRKDWEGIFQAIGHPALILDPSGRVIHANAAAVKDMGISVDRIIGRKCYDVFHQSTQRVKGCPFEKSNATGCLETVEIEIEALNGIFLVSCTPVFDHEGQLEKVIHIATDITDRKRAEEEKERLEAKLQQARKMEAIGTLTAGIAHDYNNLLTIIMGNIGLVKDDVKPGSRISKFLNRAEIAVLRTRDLTHRLMALSDGGAPIHELGSIGNLLGETLEEMSPHEGIEFEYSLDISPGLWPVLYDGTQMQYAIGNVLENAMEALPPRGGAIHIQIDNMAVDDGNFNSELPLEKGNYVNIVIKDNGSGIPEELLTRIFDPYFSTKEKGVQKGMGLGLPTAYSVIRKHGGCIDVESKSGVGSSVSIYLPAWERPIFEEEKLEKGMTGMVS
ncbi:MAG: response regulator [Deltaproteobacteria bacterium]|nr:response regulator [Deltaproteobacteria bacterium]